MADTPRANDLPDRAQVVTTDGPDPQLDKLRHIHRRFETHQSFWSTIHEVGLEDDRFRGGDQWPHKIKHDREEDGRPCLTYNLLPSFGRQITNRMRQDRPQIKVIPYETDRRTGKQPQIQNTAGNEDYSLADVYNGMLKNIEQESRADQAYDTASKHAVDHGFGFFYLMPEWDSRDPFVQTLRIRRIKNSYTVTLDPDSEEADFRDMQDAFMYTYLSRSTFEQKWPLATATNFFGHHGSSTLKTGWYNNDEICIARYFWVDHKKDEVVRLSNGKTVYVSDVESVLDELEQEFGIHVLQHRKKGVLTDMRKPVRRPVCMYQKMTYSDVLEGPSELPFPAIPVFPVLGEEMIVDGEMRFEGAFRHAKDAQRSYNYWRTAGAETVALSPKVPYIIADEQIRGYESEWEQANERNFPYLRYRYLEGAGLPMRQSMNNAAVAEMQQAVQDGVDMQTIIGLHDASLGRESNEKSGKAIAERKEQGNTSTFQFPDNLSRAQEQCGRLIVAAIPRLWDTERVQRIRLPDGSEDFVMLNEEVTDKTTGNTVLVHDIASVAYDVTIDTGPSYQTQRQEDAANQLELMKLLGPDRANNIAHLFVKNYGSTGSDEVYAILRKMLPEELKTTTEREADLPNGVSLNEQGFPVDEQGQPWQPPPSRDQQLMERQQKIDEAKAQAEIAAAEADQATADADKKEAEAKIAKAQADLEKAKLELKAKRDELASSMQAGELPAGAVDMQDIEKIIVQVMKEHETNPDAHEASAQEQASKVVKEAMKRIRVYVDNQIERITQALDAFQSAQNPTGGAANENQ